MQFVIFFLTQISFFLKRGTVSDHQTGNCSNYSDLQYNSNIANGPLACIEREQIWSEQPIKSEYEEQMSYHNDTLSSTPNQCDSDMGLLTAYRSDISHQRETTNTKTVSEMGSSRNDVSYYFVRFLYCDFNF